MRLPFLLLLTCGTVALAFEDSQPAQYQPKVAPASEEPTRALKGFRIPKGFDLSLWAAEPFLANPVVFTIDHRGRVYVAETFRLHQGVTDIRGHMDWLDEDLACRTIEDRLAMYRRRLGKKFAEYGVHHERIRLLEDRKGAGKADHATVFADGFNRPEDGIAAGLLARGQDVWYACIPNLWMLRDAKGEGRAQERKVLHTGYGVHVGFLGHDLHGLIMGPDGKLYFSIGDRGMNVKTADRHLFYPDTGAILRCNPDGSDLEVFASGLRNPQELAFDQHGNLFTGDNNSDGGDRARWVYAVEGGDSGWRIGYQFGSSMGNRGPWNAEKLWHPQHPGQPAWHIPPIINIADGPSGLTYYPGVGLPSRYDHHFFLADFRGGAGNSGIRSFSVKPKGAGFELDDSHEFLWNILATDVDFGPDCALYVSDWVHGWGLTGKGRIWKLQYPTNAKDSLVAETRRLLSEGMHNKGTKSLGTLLEHRDMRVRLEAQFALAQRGKDGVSEFATTLKNSKNTLARLHAIWGTGQVAARDRSVSKPLISLVADEDAEVRAQAARVLGDCRTREATPSLIRLLSDPVSRVRFFAAQSLGKLGDSSAVSALLTLVRENSDRDVYLRHAGVLGLVGCADRAQLREASRDASPAVRRAVVLTYRRLGSPNIAAMLQDSDPEIVNEAARAINDVPIEAAMSPLAALSERRGMRQSLGYRVLNARFRSGKPEDALAVARFAARSGELDELRLEAVKMLGDWDKPGPRDRVMGVYRPVEARVKGHAATALRASLGGIFTGSNQLRQEAAKVAARLGITEIGPTLYRLVVDASQSEDVRLESLRALSTLKDSGLEAATRLALEKGTPRLRAEARKHLLTLNLDAGIAALQQALETGTLIEKQQAFQALGSNKSEKCQSIILSWFDRLLEGKVEPSLRLDLLEAAEQQGTPTMRQRLSRYEMTRLKGDPLGRYRDTLEGGDPDAGRRVFLHKPEVSCLRCHKAEGIGTGEVGPELTGIGSKQSRDYLLESILYPNKQIAKGFETIELVLVTGQVRSGILKSESDREVQLLTAEGTSLTVPKNRIEERRSGKSAMPEDLIKHLTRQEIRDLVAYLASLKEPGKK